QRDVSVVETSELLVTRSGRDASIAEEARRREVAASRRAEQLEDRVAAIDVAERAAAVGAAVNRRIGRRGKELGRVSGPIARRGAAPSRPSTTSTDSDCPREIAK